MLISAVERNKEFQLILEYYVKSDAQNLTKYGLLLIEKEDDDDILVSAVDAEIKQKHSTV